MPRVFHDFHQRLDSLPQDVHEVKSHPKHDTENSNMNDSRPRNVGNNSENIKIVSNNTCSLNNCYSSNSRVALPVLPVKIRASSGVCIDTYALLDSGSTDSFCSEKLINKLNISGPVQTLSLNTLDNQNMIISTQVVDLKVKGKNETETIRRNGSRQLHNERTKRKGEGRNI